MSDLCGLAMPRLILWPKPDRKLLLTVKSRDIRVRWALEEAGLPYRVKSVPFHDRNAQHFAHQPFGQVP
jgi:Glutathione S-transferase, N-terminal domain